jgi:hypothetical protein
MSTTQGTPTPTKEQLKFKKALKGAIRRIVNQREEIIEAFMAKYGIDPAHMRQIVENTPTGLKWHIERIAPEKPPVVK